MARIDYTNVRDRRTLVLSAATQASAVCWCRCNATVISRSAVQPQFHQHNRKLQRAEQSDPPQSVVCGRVLVGLGFPFPPSNFYSPSRFRATPCPFCPFPFPWNSNRKMGTRNSHSQELKSKSVITVNRFLVDKNLMLFQDVVTEGSC